MTTKHNTYLHGRGGISWACCPGDGVYYISATGRKSLSLPLNMDNIIDQVIKNVHEGNKNASAQDRAIIHEQYGQFRDAIQAGLGNTSMQLQFGTPNQEMAKNLQTNAGLFAAFKKHDMVKEVVAQLKDDSGKLKPYNQFRQDALSIIGEYRESWLQAEYNTAVRCSRMAAQWAKFQSAKSIYPNLRYTLSSSAHRREDHEHLVGTVLPIDHSFWDTHFPPNGWQCKCSVTNTDEKPTEVPPSADILEMFAFNPGKHGMVFNVDQHPYSQVTKKEYQDVTKQAWGALCSYERQQIIKQAKDSGMIHKKFTIPGLSAPVQLNRNTYEQNLSFDAHFLDKLSLLSHIDKVLEDSQVIMTDNRKPAQHVKQYHILQHTTADGKRVNLHVQERKDGKMLLDYIHIQK